jgi:hypothetical protein
MRITSIGVQNKILQNKFVSRKQHSSVHSFIGLNTLPGVVISNKNISGKITTEIVPDDLILISSREDAILAATKVELVICNRWEINPEYEKVLS